MARTKGTCRNCNYDLYGLPDAGACPECGATYDRHTGKGVVAGGARQLLAGQWLHRVGTIILGLLAFCAISCTGFPLIMSGLAHEVTQKIVSWGGACAILLVMLTLASYFGEKGDPDDGDSFTT